MRTGTRRTWPTIVGALVLLTGLPLASPAPAAASSSDLYFSEYVEGSSNNKALEIYNDTGSAVDLASAGYSVQMFFNGNASAGLTINLTGTVAQGDVFVLAHSSASPSIIALADQTNGAGWFNGDDAVALRNGTTLIDVIGQIGVDPGSEWGSGLASTADNTLRRKGSVTAGDADGGNAFDPSVEWFGYPTDTISGLGSFEAAPSIVASSPADGALHVAPATNIDVTFDEPVNVNGSWFSIICATTGAHTAAVSGGPTTFTLNPDVDFGALELCTLTVFAAQVTDLDTNDPPNTMAANGVVSFTTEGNVCALPFVHAYEIQGSGMSAAITGNVTTQGVVVGDFQGPTSVGLRGFYLQDAAGDSDAQTSDGLFVFTGNADNGLASGDVVRVTGSASDFNGQTQVSASSVVSCGTTATITPVQINLPWADAGAPEPYEGMLVELPQALVISEYFNYDRFGELVLALPLAGEDRAFTPTSIEQPGAPAQARLEQNQLRRITLDDGLDFQNPPSVRHPNGQPFSLANRFRGGDLVADTVGVLGDRLGVYRIQPTAAAEYTAVNPRPAMPEPVGGSLQVASMNTLNFFLTLDDGTPSCGPAQNLDCRGADDATEFTRQRDKVLAALSGLGAEVIGLNELENTQGVDPLGDATRGIVPGLNALLGAGTFSYIDTGAIGTDAIRVGLVYKPAAVTPVGAFQILDSSDDPRFIDTKSRPVLAQTFRDNATGALFTVAVNHLKSKGSDCKDLGDPDAGDGQGNCNGTRELAAQALVDWLATDPTGSGDPDFLIIGDLNSYAREDPITAIRAGADDTAGTGDDYTNLVAQYLGTFAYSYVFDGMAGYLDHALSSASLTAQVTSVAEWHINADEPDILDYDTTFKPPAQGALYQQDAYRASDHDPVLVGLSLTPNAGKVTGSGTWADGSFEISAQFRTGAASPTGNATFVVPAGTVVSTGFDWLSVSGNEATLQGTATLDGVAGYGFVVAVLDGGAPATSDRIRVKVWDGDGNVIFDSQPSAPFWAMPTAPLASGNVAVHKLS